MIGTGKYPADGMIPDIFAASESQIIAAHAADVAKGIPGARDWDDAMGRARADLDWNKMLGLAIDPDKARRYRESSPPGQEDTCTMCGKMCAVRNMNRVLEGKDIQLND
jgi:phosphomethylpyrimidine synthase